MEDKFIHDFAQQLGEAQTLANDATKRDEVLAYRKT
jgi:hypothetical protein